MGSVCFGILLYSIFVSVVVSVTQSDHDVYLNAKKYKPGSGQIERAYTDDKRRYTIRQKPDRCDGRDKKSIFTYGHCGDQCLKIFDILQLSRACGPLFSFGCHIDLCDYSSTSGSGVKCKLDPERSRDLITCPGGKIVLNEIDISDGVRVPFRIGLNAPPGKTDVYLLADNTYSMGFAIDTAVDVAIELTDMFGSRPSFAFGVGRYGDETELTNGFENMLSITERKDSAQQAIRRWRASGGGGDVHEANLVALYKVATNKEIGWRDGSRRFLIYFGDTPGHEPSCVNGRLINRRVVYAALITNGITLVTAKFGNLDARPAPYPRTGCTDSTVAGEGQATEITMKTGGKVIPGRRKSDFVNAITPLLNNLTSSYDVEEGDCMKYITSVHSPALPVTLEPGDSTVITNTIQIKSNICGTEGMFHCRYTYTENGPSLQGTTGIKVIRVKGCK